MLLQLWFRIPAGSVQGKVRGWTQLGTWGWEVAAGTTSFPGQARFASLAAVHWAAAHITQPDAEGGAAAHVSRMVGRQRQNSTQVHNRVCLCGPRREL